MKRKEKVDWEGDGKEEVQQKGFYYCYYYDDDNDMEEDEGNNEQVRIRTTHCILQLTIDWIGIDCYYFAK